MREPGRTAPRGEVCGGRRKVGAAAIIDYALWEELLEMLEDAEDEGELQRLREEGQDALSWVEAKMHINLA